MPSSPTPDLAGFVDAQQRLRDNQGEDITFFYPVEVTFAPGTPIDAQTGRPYDPMVEPVASAQASGMIRCGVAFRALSRSGTGTGEADVGAAGYFDTDHVMLNAPIYAASAASAAVSFVARGEQYKVTAQKDDGIGVVARRLIYGRRRK